MVLALQVWRHWLDGAKHPFVNSRKACWALFLERFNLILTTRPGSKNSKANALSQHFAPDSAVYRHDHIIPSPGIVAAVHWEIEEVVMVALSSEAAGLFVSGPARSQVVQWGHSSKLASTFIAQWLSLNRRSGGLPWAGMFRSLSRPVMIVLTESPSMSPSKVLPDCLTHFLCPLIHEPTFCYRVAILGR